MPLQPGEKITAENHYYIVTDADGADHEVTALGWTNVQGDLMLTDPTGAEVRRFIAGTWTNVRPMPQPEGEEV
jgi:hypothetical protein